MDRLWVLGEIIPEIGRVGVSIQVGLRITLLSVDEDGELGRVSEEEDGSVVGDKVPVTFARLELDRESTGITVSVGRTGLSTDGRESSGQGDLGSLFEHVGETEVLESIGTFENSVSSTSLGVNNTLGNPLSVKVTEQIDQVEILEQQRSVLAGSLNLVGVGHGHTIASGVNAFRRLGLSVLLVGGELRVVGRTLGLAVGETVELVSSSGSVVAHCVYDNRII